MSSYDILPTPKKDEKIRLWGQENFRRIRDALVITNGYVTAATEDVDTVEDAIAALSDRVTALEQSQRGNREIGYAAKHDNQLGVGTVDTDLIGLNVTVRIRTRPILIIVEVQYKKMTAAGYVNVDIYDVTAGAVVQYAVLYVSSSNAQGVTVAMVRLTPPPGLRTYKVRAKAQNNTADFFASGIQPSFIQVIELDPLEPAILDDFPIHFDTLDELQTTFSTLDDVQDYQV